MEPGDDGLRLYKSRLSLLSDVLRIYFRFHLTLTTVHCNSVLRASRSIRWQSAQHNRSREPCEPCEFRVFFYSTHSLNIAPSGTSSHSAPTKSTSSTIGTLDYRNLKINSLYWPRFHMAIRCKEISDSRSLISMFEQRAPNVWEYSTKWRKRWPSRRYGGFFFDSRLLFHIPFCCSQLWHLSRFLGCQQMAELCTIGRW